MSELSIKKVSVINKGVDTERFTPGPKDPTIVDNSWLTDKRVLLCLARLDKRKGQDMLIRSIPPILERVPNAILLLVGAGEDHDRLIQLRRELDLESSVIFTGLAADAERGAYYRTADVYVMPNRTLSRATKKVSAYSFSRLARGKPVLVEGLEAFLMPFWTAKPDILSTDAPQLRSLKHVSDCYEIQSLRQSLAPRV